MYDVSHIFQHYNVPVKPRIKCIVSKFNFNKEVNLVDILNEVYLCMHVCMYSV
jgi:hypothetical protein